MLNRKTLAILLFVLIARAADAQTRDSVLFGKLGDFDLARLYGDSGEALRLAEGILSDTAKLTPRAKISFFGRLANLYQDQRQQGKAVVYYQKVVAAVPEYYVAQRALGYLIDSAAEEIHLKLYQLKSDDPTFKTMFESYKKQVLMALPHLERGQACDPNDRDMDIIRTLYQNIHDERDLDSLERRLKTLGKNCMDILSDN